MKRIFLFAAAYMAMVACSSPLSRENETRVEKIDSLKSVLTTVENELQPWQDSTLDDDAEQAQQLYVYLEKTYPDKENRVFWITQMNALKKVYKAFGKFHKAKTVVTEKIPLSRKQLQTLENSIREDALEEKQIEEYMVIETQEVNKIYDLYFRISPEVEASASIWDTLRVSMNQIKMDLDTLK